MKTTMTSLRVWNNVFSWKIVKFADCWIVVTDLTSLVSFHDVDIYFSFVSSRCISENIWNGVSRTGFKHAEDLDVQLLLGSGFFNKLLTITSLDILQFSFVQPFYPCLILKLLITDIKMFLSPVLLLMISDLIIASPITHDFDTVHLKRDSIDQSIASTLFDPNKPEIGQCSSDDRDIQRRNSGACQNSVEQDHGIESPIYSRIKYETLQHCNENRPILLHCQGREIHSLVDRRLYPLVTECSLGKTCCQQRTKLNVETTIGWGVNFPRYCCKRYSPHVGSISTGFSITFDW